MGSPAVEEEGGMRRRGVGEDVEKRRVQLEL